MARSPARRVLKATLAGGPPARRDVVSATATAGALARVLVAMIGVFYVWAQGGSFLSATSRRPPP